MENQDSTEFPPSGLYYGERALLCWRVDQLKISASELRNAGYQVQVLEYNDRAAVREAFTRFRIDDPTAVSGLPQEGGDA